MRFALNVGNSFVPEEELKSQANQIVTSLDRRNLDGALYVTCNGIEVIGESEHDLIDQLLCYIVNDIDAIFRGEEFKTYFPDQPLPLTINTKRDNIFITVGHKRAMAPRRVFLRELYHLCRRFFELMLILFPSGWDESYLKALKALPPRYPDILGDFRG